MIAVPPQVAARRKALEEEARVALAGALRERHAVDSSLEGGTLAGLGAFAGVLDYADVCSRAARRLKRQLDADVDAKTVAYAKARASRLALDRLNERRRRAVQERLESAP